MLEFSKSGQIVEKPFHNLNFSSPSLNGPLKSLDLHSRAGIMPLGGLNPAGATFQSISTYL